MGTVSQGALFQGCGLACGPRHSLIPSQEPTPKPLIWAAPGPMVAAGNPVTIWCQGSRQADTYRLFKAGASSDHNPWAHRDSRQAQLPPGLRRTGQLCLPHLRQLVQSDGPFPAWGKGENVTLQCLSEVCLDTFHLCKQGSAAPPQHGHAQDGPVSSLASFTLNAVTLVHGVTYRCYGSHSATPYLLSPPREPLELGVSGGPEDQPLTPTDPGPQSGE
ncbi:leukocyte immunoglobulin-like receptor subfamily B member 4 [Marmota marmota marmota]|uniref:leukocyte immunoglobulin-like receptor subfamily B member 4 n=1 Tax=Marmota marmota marmota TaxID=9994 RepID=UPI002093A13E|nr:leukocyte immunoglobulin-like receptor subfamily B member 4 [Marmota marmota marmota]